ncbi:MAG: response regulator [Candidatus Binatia bacterium]
MARRSSVPESDQTILIVDDQEETLTSVRGLLEREGHRVLTAECGERALALFKQHEVDLLLVDYVMPRMNGPELVRKIRSLDPFAQIILQTGYSGARPPRTAVADLDIQGYHDKADGPEKLLLWVDIGLKIRRLIKQLREQLTGRETAHSTLTVLVADDRSARPQAVKELFAQEGVRVLGAPSHDTALEQFARERPDVIIVDQDIGQAGGDLLRRVRALDPTVPLILQCGRVDPAQRRRLMSDLDLHGIHERDADPNRLLDLVQCVRAGIRRAETVHRTDELRNLMLLKFCHDLRTPLHVIRGYAEILRDPDSIPIEEIVSRLEAASESALDLTQDYLNLARLESPGLLVRREPVVIDALLEDVRAVAKRQIGTRPLRVTVRPPFADAFINTDGEKLRGILTQLVANAIKFSLSGEIRLFVCSEPTHTDFVLSDTRLRDDHDDLSRVLSSPRDVPSSVVRNSAAQDFGLAIAQRLSTLIGASLAVQVPEHSGAVFTLSVPVPLTRRTEALRPTLH